MAVSPPEHSVQLGDWCDRHKLERGCRRWLASEGLLLDEDAHIDRTLAILMLEQQDRPKGRSAGKRQPEDGAEDIHNAARRAAEALLKQDYNRVRVGDLAAWGHSARDRFLVQGLGFSPRVTALVAVHFNSLQRELRRALLDILILHRPAEELLRQEGIWDSVQGLYNEIRATLVALRNLEA